MACIAKLAGLSTASLFGGAAPDESDGSGSGGGDGRLRRHSASDRVLPRVYFASLHAAALSAVALTRNTLSDGLYGGTDYFWPLMWFATGSLGLVLYVAAFRRDPGYLQRGGSLELAETGMAGDAPTRRTHAPSLTTAVRSDPHHNNNPSSSGDEARLQGPSVALLGGGSGIGSSGERRRREEAEADRGSELGDASLLLPSGHRRPLGRWERADRDFPDPVVELRFCDRCRLVQPLRTKHCKICKRCVRKYDHHCPWLGTCVGEGNHTLFYLMLATEALATTWTATVLWGAVTDAPSISAWFVHNVIVLAVATAMTGLSCLPLGLCVAHSYFVASNTTTWEASSQRDITYLKGWESYNPFSEGVASNMRWFFCGPSEPREWRIQPGQLRLEMMDPKEREISDDCLNNRYYSCF